MMLTRCFFLWFLMKQMLTFLFFHFAHKSSFVLSIMPYMSVQFLLKALLNIDDLPNN